MYIVTGSNGFIGSAFVWELNQHGIKDILCVDDFGKDDRWKNIRSRQVQDTVGIAQFLEMLKSESALNQITAVIHMGACSSTAEINMDYLLQNNVQYSQTLFRWCTEHKVPFVYASSCATYGAGELGFDDAIPAEALRPLNPYGYSKVLFDRWALSQKRTPEKWIGLKFSNVFGPQEYHKGEQASVAFKAYQQIQTKGTLQLFRSLRPDFKDGEQKRDFVYIKDVTSWMYQILQKFPKNGVYNMGSGTAKTWMDLAEGVFSAMKKPVKIDWIDIPLHLRDHYQYFTEAKMERLRTQGIGVEKWGLKKGVEDYVINYLAKENRYL
ncbi:MAG: ADP-glyceromanno-heptose 6-epimerase [Bdellovibrionales bacterium]|nr:ADP-glyceromanno-heptose 6-epimerase [Bdellovibrionales bacterium]